MKNKKSKNRKKTAVKIITLGMIMLALISMPLKASALGVSVSVSNEVSEHENIGPTIREQRGEDREERKEIREEAKAEKKELREEQHDLFSQLKEKIQEVFTGNVAAIIDGQITAVGTSSLTISKDGKDYTVNITSDTKLRRRFWGKAGASDFTVGDHVNVWGRFTDSAKTTIDANLIRDLSIQRRNGVFFGNVTQINGTSGFSMDTINRGNQTVTVSSGTKLISRNERAILFSDIKVGDRVRVRGLWDRIANTITEVREVKDFGLLSAPSATATPTLTVTPSATPTLTPTPTP